MTNRNTESSDPCSRLRSLVQQQYKTEAKNNNRKVQRGGVLLALIPIGVAIASALGSKFAGDMYDWVKKKITGGKINVPHHKTKKNKELNF